MTVHKITIPAGDDQDTAYDAARQRELDEEQERVTQQVARANLGRGLYFAALLSTPFWVVGAIALVRWVLS